jgi:hypothetical protein
MRRGPARTQAEADAGKYDLLDATGVIGTELLRSVPADRLAATLIQPVPPMPSDTPVYSAARDLLNMMIIRSTTRDGSVKIRDFERARRMLMADSAAQKLAPECVRVCRSPEDVWGYIKAQEGLDTYDSRRRFLRAEFEPLLTALERFESSPLDDLVESRTASLDSAGVSAAWEKALQRRSSDPPGAITAARTLLESTCKTILEDRDIKYSDRDDLPKLYSLVSKELKLAPSDHTETQIKAILGACTTVVKELGSLRNRVSDSHGSGRRRYRLAERHAALAVNLAGSMALFLMETHEARD